MNAKNISKVASTSTPKVAVSSAKGLQVKTQLKAGRAVANHNETLVRATAKGKVPAGITKSLQVKTKLKAGGGFVRGTAGTLVGANTNHNETLIRDAAKSKVPTKQGTGLQVKTSLKAGGAIGYITYVNGKEVVHLMPNVNHNETLVRDVAE